MTRSEKPAKSWRQLAAEVAQESDPQKVAQLTDELLEAMEEEKRQFDARSQLAADTPQKLR